MKNNFRAIIFTTACLALVVFGIVFVSETDHQTIRDWATAEDYNITAIEKTILDNGPFWLSDEDDRIYRVKVLDHHHNEKVIYFRFGLWGAEKKWK